MPGAATGLQHATGAIGISCDKVAISHSSFVFHRPSSTNFDLAYRLHRRMSIQVRRIEKERRWVVVDPEVADD